jgi:hypothetical protein
MPARTLHLLNARPDRLLPPPVPPTSSSACARSLLKICTDSIKLATATAAATTAAATATTVAAAATDRLCWGTKRQGDGVVVLDLPALESPVPKQTMAMTPSIGTAPTPTTRSSSSVVPGRVTAYLQNDQVPVLVGRNEDGGDVNQDGDNGDGGGATSGNGLHPTTSIVWDSTSTLSRLLHIAYHQHGEGECLTPIVRAIGNLLSGR